MSHSDTQPSATARQDAARTLAEDLGFPVQSLGGVATPVSTLTQSWQRKDLTAGLIDPEKTASATLLAREGALLCGMPWVIATIELLDPHAKVYIHVPEGSHCQPSQVVATLTARAQALLTAERTAINFLQLLSAVATQTERYVKAIAHTHAKIFDTRKTLPGLRAAQRYAVRIGGGHNHRFGLNDAILLKENHLAVAGGIPQALQQLNETQASNEAAFVQLEVETLAQLEEALFGKVKLILLDNMDLPTISEAVRRNQMHPTPAVLEVSGGVHLENLCALAETGVDRISVGSLTKNIQSIDFSMRISSPSA